MLGPWKEAYDKTRQCIKKTETSLGQQVHKVKAVVFQGKNHRCKDGRVQKICVLEKTLERPLGNKDIKLVNPKGNHSEYSLEGLMLKLQHFSHLMQRVNSLEKPLMLRLPLMLGKIEGKGRRVQ